MKKNSLRHALMGLSIPVALGTAGVQAAEPTSFEAGQAVRSGLRISTDKPVNSGAGRAAQVISTDYSRLQGTGLLLNETMLGTMDERLGMDAETRSDDKRIWVRLGGAYQNAGGAKGKGRHAVDGRGRGIGQ